MHKKAFLVIGIFLVVIFGKFVIGALSFSPIVLEWLFNKNIELKRPDSINVLLLGISGGTHEGPLLSDTIIFSNIDQKKNKVTLLSIPRDLWVPDLKEKINTAYAIGEAKRKGGGIPLARAAIAKVVNKPIDYVVVVNFDGFIKAVDLIGGLPIIVDTMLDDYEYPIEGGEQDACGHSEEELTSLATASSQLEAFPCRYTHLHFDKGRQVISGNQALAFVRSRHAQGEEGTDFARSKRQEKVISAFKEKMFSAETLLNPLKLVSLYATLRENIDTDVKKEEIDDFAKLAQTMKGVKIVSGVLDYGDENTGRKGLLINPDISPLYDNQWVLIPRVGNGSFLEIQEYITCLTTKETCPIK